MCKKIDKALLNCINCTHRGGFFDDCDCKIHHDKINASDCPDFDLVHYSSNDPCGSCTNKDPYDCLDCDVYQSKPWVQ